MRIMIAIPCSFALLLALPALARATTQTWLVTRALCEVGELKFGMQTPIGQGLKSGGASSWLATAAGIGSVALHLFLAATDRPASWYDAVAVFATLATTGIAVTRRDAASFGFRLSPLQGWAYWAATAFVLVGLMGLVYWVTMSLGAWPVHSRRDAPHLGHHPDLASVSMDVRAAGPAVGGAGLSACTLSAASCPTWSRRGHRGRRHPFFHSACPLGSRRNQ